ncbi:hypothetical protein [Butyrivibrio sp. AE3006]|uniref:hypothetical protein n=1 Tax=Butyrivibrio sp. AE3006 TaxID=1280673 RepID=UPI000409BA32|nr:hypothetical protein [Butyrivibrio sp. AE3006]
MESEVMFNWNNPPRVITYSDPKRIFDKVDRSLIKKYPHVCASDTLMQGLEEKYGRESFSIIGSVSQFISSIFRGGLDDPSDDLQLYLNVSNAIDSIDEHESLAELGDYCKKAFIHNKSQLIDAVKLLVFAGVDKGFDKYCHNEEQEVFYNQVFLEVKEDYERTIEKAIKSITKSSIKDSMTDVLLSEINYQLNKNSKERIKTKEEALTFLKALCDGDDTKIWDKKKANNFINVLNQLETYDYGTFVFHGILRFTPEIIKTLEVLDRLGIHIIFLINYVDNLDSIYGVWKKSYSWITSDFENVDSLNLGKGSDVGRRIADVCSGIRIKDQSTAQFREYRYLTEFTDRIRDEYSSAQKKNKNNTLASMGVQFYAVKPDNVNDILRNYFPDQFSDKPFMAYPIGRFIKGIYSMWNFDDSKMEIDFKELKECSVVGIGHNNSKMISVIDMIQLYFKGLTDVEAILARGEELKAKNKMIDECHEEQWRYLSFYSLQDADIDGFLKFICTLNGISKDLFMGLAKRDVDYKKHFSDTMQLVSSATAENTLISEKELELISMLLDCLRLTGDSDVHGASSDLEDALQFYLSAKRKKSGSDWIVRGFDQLDGAPFLCERSHKTYEFSLLSMKNMTANGNDIIPWPLDEEMLSNCHECSIYLSQMKNIVDTKKDYLLFYLFYGTFFSKAGITFSYVKDEDDIKQRPFFVVDMIRPIKPLKRNGELDEGQTGQLDSAVSSQNENYNLVLDKRDERLYSICSYKYFISKVLGRGVNYLDEYHIKYFIENEACYWISEKCEYSRKNIDREFKALRERLLYWFPFLDEADLSDIKRFVSEKFYLSKPQLDYIQTKRDFLIAKWEEDGVNYMNFKAATKEDIRKYLMSSRLENDTLPHKKVCQECNYNPICMKYYYDKVTE